MSQRKIKNKNTFLLSRNLKLNIDINYSINKNGNKSQDKPNVKQDFQMLSAKKFYKEKNPLAQMSTGVSDMWLQHRAKKENRNHSHCGSCNWLKAHHALQNGTKGLGHTRGGHRRSWAMLPPRGQLRMSLNTGDLNPGRRRPWCGQSPDALWKKT